MGWGREGVETGWGGDGVGWRRGGVGTGWSGDGVEWGRDGVGTACSNDWIAVCARPLRCKKNFFCATRMSSACNVCDTFLTKPTFVL